MKIISWNVNGIRAIYKKGALQNFLETYTPDIICFQETKAQPEQMDFLEAEFSGYTKFYHSAQKAGYAGTAIWIKKEIFSKLSEVNFVQGFDKEIGFDDDEGRIARLDFSKEISGTLQKISLLGVYFPNGGKSEEAWSGETGKLTFYTKFLEQINILRNQERKVIFCGDVNTCHQTIDIARPKENEGKIGFHPLERESLSEWVSKGWIDVWRNTHPEKTDQYSWWSYRGGARNRNVGWRIDYFFVDKKLIPEISEIKYLNDQMGSDHCPVLLEI